MIGAQLQSVCPAKKGTDHTYNMGIMNDLTMDKTYYTLCAQQVHSLPQGPAGKPVGASLLGHSSLVALCSLAFSQG